MSLVLFLSTAWGLGVFVGPADAVPTSPSAQLVWADDGFTATLTVSPSVETDTTELGWLLPVAAPVAEGDAVTVTDTLFDTVWSWTNPTLDALTCDALFPVEVTDPIFPDGYIVERDPRPPVWYASPLSSVGATLTLTSLDDAEAVSAWLAEQDWEGPDGGEAALERWLEDGGGLVAVTVVLDEAPVGPVSLPAVQVPWPLGGSVLPTSAWALSAEGEQELGIVGLMEGAVAITGLEPVAVEDECMVPEDADASTYEALVAEALEAPGWTREASLSCCSEGEVDSALRDAAGVDLTSSTWWVSRARVRLEQTPVEDLGLSAEAADTVSMDYITALPELESLYPSCGEGFAADPGTCEWRELGCASTGGGPLALAWLALAAVGLRRSP